MARTRSSDNRDAVFAVSVDDAEVLLSDLLAEVERLYAQISALEVFIRSGREALEGSAADKRQVKRRPETNRRTPARAPAPAPSVPNGPGVGGRQRLRGTTLGVLAWMSAQPKRTFTTADVRRSWPVSSAMVQKVMPRLHEYGYVDEVKHREYRVNAAGLAAVEERQAEGEEIPQPMA